MRIVCLGSGNVATHLAEAFSKGGHELSQIWSRKLEHAQQLGQRVQAEAIDDLGKLEKGADLYIIAVKDDVIADVAGSLTGLNGLIVHTSGNTPMHVLGHLSNYGVLYPLQTFSKGKPLDFRRIPLCIEAVNGNVLARLKAVARSLSDAVYTVDTGHRKILHLAAVFACNFTNHLYYIGQQLVEEGGMDFDLIKPLIAETADKIKQEYPNQVQTGPAVRADEKTIQGHLAMLEGHKDLQEIYTILSRSIKKARQ